MNLIGSRQTLIANICALIMAFAVAAEGAHIDHECFGFYRPQNTWGFFFPVLVMFIIRNRIYSFCFLALHIALFSQMFYQAGLIPVDPEACGGRDDPLGYMALFFVISAICLAIYPVIAVVSFIISLVASKE